MCYLLNKKFQELTETSVLQPEDEILEFLDFEEAETFCRGLKHHKVLCRNLRESINCCKVEMLSDAIIGTLLVPAKGASFTSGVSLIFYFEKQHLVLIDDRKQLNSVQPHLIDEFQETADNTYRFFFDLLESLIDGDTIFLQNYEQRLATMEESLTDTLPKELKLNVSTGRRELLLFQSYYQQLLDMFEILSENINHFFPEEYQVQFQRLISRADRLYDNTQMLREYAYQIREMHQAQIDIRQNDTIRILTVVTSLFFPLSLITGWYGMNFVNMPELQQPFAYFILAGLCTALVIGEIWYFKKKGWL